MSNAETIEQVVARYHQTDDLLMSTAYSDGGTDGGSMMLGARLARAAGNQDRGDTAAFSRYAIWANTVRDHVLSALESISRSGTHAGATEHLRVAANSLSAFSDIQSLLDTMGMGKRPEYLRER